MSENPSAPEFFEAKYQWNADPWNFAKSEYELQRYDAIIAALAPRRYARAFEPGCSVGVLTEKLAALCDAVEAVDFSATAVARARERCAYLPHVEIRILSLRERMPLEGFDLVVLSEIGYYFCARDWKALVAELVGSLPSGTTLLAAHWLGESPEHQIPGDEVHAILRAEPLLLLQHAERHEHFRLDRWLRA